MKFNMFVATSGQYLFLVEASSTEANKRTNKQDIISDQ